ncbi:MAG: VPLPA-CTERM sorting domain-containing protein [Methylococcales bacterium]
MIKKTKLARSIALVVAGSALTIGAVSTAAAAPSATYYNTFTTPAASFTDGWTRIADTNNDGYGTGPESQGNKGLIVAWAGTTGNKLPFGYVGSSHLNWAAMINNAGDSLEISGADSLARYGFDAEIDTGAGAWLDDTGTGWKHQTDIGLVKSAVTQKVTINLTTLGSINNNFGVTVFTGMDTNTGNYSHHGRWNCPTCTTPVPFEKENPFGTTGLAFMKYDASVDSTNSISFTALADQVYSIYLGGNGVGSWSQNVAGYKLNLSTSPVPVPGAVWLFGSALAGVLGLRRRKQAI